MVVEVLGGWWGWVGLDTAFPALSLLFKNLGFSLHETFMNLFSVKILAKVTDAAQKYKFKSGRELSSLSPHRLQLENLPLLFPHKTAAFQTLCHTIQVKLDMLWVLCMILRKGWWKPFLLQEYNLKWNLSCSVNLLDVWIFWMPFYLWGIECSAKSRLLTCE